jgi:urea carboxylase
LGGFVCPAVLAKGELWKLGQLQPGDKVRFRAMSFKEAAALNKGAPVIFSRAVPHGDVLKTIEADDVVVYRRAGDDNILVEYGAMALDLRLRLKAHLLMQAVQEAKWPGMIDLTPGIRSLQVHYDNELISETQLLDGLCMLERDLPAPESISVKSRTVHLPLSWNDPQVQLAMRKYQELVRPNAPWCPSNIEFIRRINGLDSEDEVRRIVFDAEYLVLGLGDVYLGAPVATPLDPRHRLVTTKYNPARTWTPENAVGIGGAYLCVYGMEGPGGYQLFGRTIQMWNRWRATDCFEEGKPWLLRFFDKIRFFPVSAEELLEARAAFPHGCYRLRIEEGEFTLAGHQRFLDAHVGEIGHSKRRQQSAFETERKSWRERGLDSYIGEDHGAAEAATAEIFPGDITLVHAPAGASVWKIEVTPGEHVAEGQTLMIIETMKMEINVPAPASGILRELRCQTGHAVKPGQVLALIGAAA